MGKLIKLSAIEAYQEHSMLSEVLTKDHYDHIADCDMNELFYDGGDSQWTADELESLEERGQYKLTINAIRKAILAEVGMLTSAKPKFSCAPVGVEDDALAGICTQLLDQSYRDSLGMSALSEICLSGLKANISYAFVRGIGTEKVIFEPLNYREVFVAPCKDAMFRDAEWIATRKWVASEKVEALFGIDQLVVQSPIDYPSFDTTYASGKNKMRIYDATRDMVEVIERFRKVVERMSDGSTRIRIKKRVLLGYGHVYEEYLHPSIVDYPIIPFYADYSNNQFKYGEVHHLRDIQRFMNKMFNLTVKSAQALSNGKVIVRKNEIPNGDVDAFATNWSAPDGVIVLNPGAKPPDVVHPTPINSSYFEIYKDAAKTMNDQYLMAAPSKYDDLALNPDSKQDWDSMVTSSMRVPAAIWETFLSQLGSVILQHTQAYVSSDNVIKVIDGNKYIQDIKTAQKVKLDASTDEGIAQWSSQMMKDGSMSMEQIETTIYKTKKAIDIVDALSDLIRDKVQLRTNVEVEPESYTATASVQNFRLIYSLAEKGIIDPSLVVDYLPIPDKEAIKSKMDSLRSTTRQIEMLNNELEKINKKLEKSEQENTELSKKIIDTKHEAGHDYRTKDTMMKKQYQKQMSALEKKIQSSSSKLELKELLLELKDAMRDNPMAVKEGLEKYLGEY